MGCCIVGSLLMVGIAALLRRVRRYLLRMPAHTPETWRLEPSQKP